MTNFFVRLRKLSQAKENSKNLKDKGNFLMSIPFWVPMSMKIESIIALK